MGHARPGGPHGHDQLLRVPARGSAIARRDPVPQRISGLSLFRPCPLYERAGRIEGSPGSITQIPILTMPNDDISHPVPDLTGYITEGQIVLDRELVPARGISRHRRAALAFAPHEGRHRNGHDPGGPQGAGASSSRRIREVEERPQPRRGRSSARRSCRELDKQYLEFGDRLRTGVLAQDEYEDRSIGQTLDLGWKLLSILPKDELVRVSRAMIEKYMPREVGFAGSRTSPRLNRTSFGKRRGWRWPRRATTSSNESARYSCSS